MTTTSTSPSSKPVWTPEYTTEMIYVLTVAVLAIAAFAPMNAKFDFATGMLCTVFALWKGLSAIGLYNASRQHADAWYVPQDFITATMIVAAIDAVLALLFALVAYLRFAAAKAA